MIWVLQLQACPISGCLFLHDEWFWEAVEDYVVANSLINRYCKSILQSIICWRCDPKFLIFLINNAIIMVLVNKPALLVLWCYRIGGPKTKMIGLYFLNFCGGFGSGWWGSMTLHFKTILLLWEDNCLSAFRMMVSIPKLRWLNGTLNWIRGMGRWEK